MDQSLHLIFADTSKVFVGKGMGIDGALSPLELQRFRNWGISKRRQNYIDTGGEKQMLDMNIQFGAQAEVKNLDTGITIIHKKL